MYIIYIYTLRQIYLFIWKGNVLSVTETVVTKCGLQITSNLSYLFKWILFSNFNKTQDTTKTETQLTPDGLLPCKMRIF